MADVRAWALALCTVALGCSLVQMIAPKGGMGRLMRMVLAAFFLCALLTPLLSLPSQLPELFTADAASHTDEAVLRERFCDRLREQTEQALTDRVGRLLKSRGIQAEKVTADMYISEEGAIYMRQVIVYLDAQNIRKATTVRTVLAEQLNVPLAIEQTGEGGAW